MYNSILYFLELIKSNITDPLNDAISSSNFFDNTIQFLNKFLNSILNIASDRELTNVEFINATFIAEFFGILFLIIFIKWLISIFKFTYKTILSALNNTLKPSENKEWRSTWRRKRK